MPYTCPQCNRTSYHPVDELVGWCGACDAYTRDTPDRTRELIREFAARGQVGLAAAVQRRLEGG